MSKKQEAPILDKSSRNWLIGIGIFGVLIIVAVIVFSTGGVSGGASDSFAQCLTDNGAKMYGAFWCPHCQDQKTRFGSSFDKIEYIECSNADRSQTAACTAAGIQSYPTWEFADGSRVGGVLTLDRLSALTGCPLNAEG